MRSILALSLMLTACLSTGGEDLGPQQGLWLIDRTPLQPWFCVREGLVCSPPAYFSPPPEEVEVQSGGVLRWVGSVEHDGALETACIRVAPGTDEGVARTETTFCNLIDAGVINETRAFAMIGWSPGTPDACTCSAHFDFAPDE